MQLNRHSVISIVTQASKLTFRPRETPLTPTFRGTGSDSDLVVRVRMWTRAVAAVEAGSQAC